MGHDPHVRPCPLGRGSACSTGPPECIHQIPCVHRACSPGRGFRASFRSFLEPEATPERSRELGWQMEAHNSLNTCYVLGAGARERSKMLPCSCGAKLRVCVLYTCNRQG